MKTNNHRAIAFGAASIVLALLTAACGESPSTPTPIPPPPPATFSVSGTISEATESGNVPLEGASVLNWGTEQAATTDANGSYALSNQHAGAAQFMVSKEGYEQQMVDVMIDRDMHL